jgi:aquaporin Z
MDWSDRLRGHWPEYVMEAIGLGLFMIAAAGCASLLQHPASPVRHAIEDGFTRRVLMGLAMGATATALIYSPLGARSGAHINPATTLAFLRLGRIHPVDAAAYIVAQFVGGAAGITVAALLLQPWIAAPSVNYVATLPGAAGSMAAFAAEATIAFLLISIVLALGAHARWAPRTGLAVGLVVALFIAVEDPLSGMSMNPARSLGPALYAAQANTLWIYFLAPPLGMLLAAEAFLRRTRPRAAGCAKLHHPTHVRCIFCGSTPHATHT